MSEIPHNLYQVLKVGRNATEKEIIKAAARLAIQFHPQLNPNNPVAAENYARVQQARYYLSDPERRAEYDRYLDTPASIESLLKKDVPTFTLNENLVFSHYRNKNAPVAASLGVGVALAGIGLAQIVEDKNNVGEAISIFAGVVTCVLYEAVKTVFDMRNYYRKVQGKTKSMVLSKARELYNFLDSHKPDFLKREPRKSLDSLIRSLPVISHPDDPEHKAILMPVVNIDGMIYARYLHKGDVVQRPVSFSYTFEGEKQSFSLNEEFQRVAPVPSSLEIPLGTTRQEIEFKPDEDIPVTFIAHALGYQAKNGEVTPLFLCGKNIDPVVLCAEQNPSFFTYHDEQGRIDIAKAVEHIYNPKSKIRMSRRDK